MNKTVKTPSVLPNYPLDNIVKSPYNDKDFQLDIPAGLTKSLPTKVDLRNWSRDIEDQSSTGSCVANAAVSALEILLERNENFKNLSRLFVYYDIRERYAKLRGVDGGAYLHDAFKSCYNIGIPDENVWTFDVSKVNIKPSDQAYAEALLQKVGKYERVGTWTQFSDFHSMEMIKATVAMGYPVIIAMSVANEIFHLTGSLDSSTCKYNKIVGSTSEYAGGHAMCVVGYDESLGGFIVENSWGTTWGDHGFGILGYECIAQACFDAWTCTEFAGIKFEPNWSFVDIPPLTASIELTKAAGYKVTSTSLFAYSGRITCNVVGGSGPYVYKWTCTDPEGVFSSQTDITNLGVMITKWAPKQTKSITIKCVVYDSSIPTQQIATVFSQITFINDTIDVESNYAKAYRLYKAAFNRIPDAGGVKFWTSVLDAGNSLVGVANGFIDSEEFKATYAGMNVVGIVDGFYKNVLSREPDYDGLMFWVNILKENRGTLAEVLVGFSESAENKTIPIM